MAKRRRYTDEERASYMAMLESQGYPDNQSAMTKVANYSKVPARTLQRWWKREFGIIPDDIVAQKKMDLASKFENVANLMLDKATEVDVMDDMSGRDLVISAATATDKMRLLRGLPTEIIGMMPEVIAALEKMNQSPVAVFQRIIERAQRDDIRH